MTTVIAPNTTAPISATLVRMAALDAYLMAEIGPHEPGWFYADDLLHNPTSALAEGLARQSAHYRTAERRTCGSFFIGDYAWYMPAAAIASYLAERRVPDLAPSNMALRYRTCTWEEDGQTGESERLDVRFLNGRFAALPNDPAADDPDALVLPDLDALRTWLRTRLEAHLAPLIDSVCTHTGLGKRAQWNLVADACAALFLYAGKALGDPARGQSEGLAFVKADGSPLHNPDTGYITLEWAGHCETFRTRGGCCRSYTRPDSDKCTTCVLRPAEERHQRLRDYLAQKYAQSPAGGA